MSKRTGYWVAILACALLASCKSAGPVKTFVKGDEINYYDFSASKQFEQGTYSTASLLVRDGVYRIDVRTGDDELWWGQGGPTVGDVVIDVDATQLSQRNENAFGVMCRVRGHVGQQVMAAGGSPEATAEATTQASATAEATASATGAATQASTAEATTSANVAAQGLAQMMAGATAEATGAATASAEATGAAAAANPLAAELAAVPDDATAQATAESTLPPATTLEDNNGDGYLFLIQGTGSFAIFRSRGRTMTPLVNWTTSDKIKVGPDTNHLRAVCVGTYLAFYANDAFLGDATDDAYSEGQVGLAASAANRLGVRIDFDNLSIASAKPG